MENPHRPGEKVLDAQPQQRIFSNFSLEFVRQRILLFDNFHFVLHARRLVLDLLF